MSGEGFETFSESGFEADFLRWLGDVGWEVYGDEDMWGSEVLDVEYGRDRDEVVYWSILKEKVIELNPEIDSGNVDRFMSSLKRDMGQGGLLEANRRFTSILSKGKNFELKAEDGSRETRAIKLLDLDSPGNNRFIAVNQFSVRQGRSSKRPDIALLVNGIPLVTVELKSIAQENDYFDAIEDLQGYEESVPRLFVPGLFNVAADTGEFRYGPVGASTEFYNPWEPREGGGGLGVRDAVQSLLTGERLLDILDRFVFYEEDSGGDNKIIPRHMQYHASNLVLDRIEDGEHRRGLIWHTQGSGKSYTMLFTAKNLIHGGELDNPQVVVLVDREKLESQMSNTLDSIDFEQYEVAESGEHLQEMLESGRSSLILTTIQKFQMVRNGSQGNPETVVLTDEAHRFMEKDLGSKLEAVLPDTYHFGFTGTPVKDSDRDTFEHYTTEDERYLHRYSIKEGIQDNLILPVVFTPRNQMEWDIDEEAIDVEFERNFSELDTEQKHEAIEENVTKRDIAELEPRVEAITENIYTHFQGVKKNGFKGLVVAPSQKAAALYGERLQNMLGEDKVEVFVSGGESTGEVVQQFETSKEERDSIVEDYKERGENPELIVVCDMLLTGFDAPILKTMYLDRNLKNHSLLQAIARTNRIRQGKNNGEIVDYQGVFQNVDDALDYSEDVRESAAINKDKLFEGDTDVQGFEPLLNELLGIFDGIEKRNSSEVLNEAVSRLEKNPQDRKSFKEGMRKLQDLYETLSPDKRLKQEDIAPRYKWLTQVRLAFETQREGEDDAEDNVREKTKEILEKNVDIDHIKDEFARYELSAEHLEEVEGLEPGVAATKIVTTAQDHLEMHGGENPRYRRLSEKLNQVVENWQSGGMEDAEAADKLERVEKQMIEVKQGAEGQDLTDYEYAFLTAFEDDYGEYLADEEPETLAKELGKQFRKRVDTDFEGWYNNEDMKNEFGTIVADVLVKENDHKDLYTEEGAELVDDFWVYAVENVSDGG